MYFKHKLLLFKTHIVMTSEWAKNIIRFFCKFFMEIFSIKFITNCVISQLSLMLSFNCVSNLNLFRKILKICSNNI